MIYHTVVSPDYGRLSSAAAASGRMKGDASASRPKSRTGSKSKTPRMAGSYRGNQNRLFYLYLALNGVGTRKW